MIDLPTALPNPRLIDLPSVLPDYRLIDQPTDEPTEEPNDAASYRDASFLGSERISEREGKKFGNVFIPQSSSKDS